MTSDPNTPEPEPVSFEEAADQIIEGFNEMIEMYYYERFGD